MYTEIVAKNLSNIMSFTGMKDQEVAKGIGCSTAAICRYRNGLRTITLDNLVALSNFFNVSVDYFLGIRAEGKARSLVEDLSIDAIKIAHAYDKATQHEQNIVYTTLSNYLLEG